MAEWIRPTELPDLRRVGRISLDLETKDDGIRAGKGAGWVHRTGHVCGISIAYRTESDVRGLYFALRHPDSDNFDPGQVYQWLRDHIKAGVRFVAHNGSYDWGWVRAESGIKMPPGAQLDETMFMAVMVDELRYAYRLADLCKWRGLPGKDETLLQESVWTLIGEGKKRGKKKVDVKGNIWRLPAHLVGPYAEADAIATLRLAEDLAPILDREGTRAAYELECDLMPMVAEMRWRGIRIDLDAAERNRDLLLRKRNEALAMLSEKIGKAVGMEELGNKTWLPDQFDREGIEYPKTELGNASFTSEWMENYVAQHDHWLPKGVVAARKYDGAAVTRGYSFQKLIEYAANGRIHAEIHQLKSEDGTHGAKSFRIIYSNPPLQQMPAHDDELAPLFRGVFLPELNEFWAKPDVSQQEFRFAVHHAAALKLPGAAAAAQRYVDAPDMDFHDYVGGLVELPRRSAKQINFGKIYGMGPKRFAQQHNIPLPEAVQRFARYDKELPFLKLLSDRCRSQAARDGFIRLYDGARRHFNRYAPGGTWQKGAGPCELAEARRRRSDPSHPWYRKPIYRTDTKDALNALIQGSAARHTKLWMRAAWQAGITPLLQMHDCLDCSVSSREQGELVARLGCEAVKLRVPIRVDLKFGRTWGDARHTWDELTGVTPADEVQVVQVPPADVPLQPIIAELGAAEAPDSAQAAGDVAPAELGDAGQADKKLNGGTQPEVAAIAITFFPDRAAQQKREIAMTLPALEAVIPRRTETRKGDLPWLKLARFGNVRTDKGCLRHDRNVVALSGVEGDVDAGSVDVDEAIRRLTAAGVTTLVYTSPSHTPERARYRVLAPLSAPIDGDEETLRDTRTRLLSRLNGVLGGVFSSESFTLSQSYYCGRLVDAKGESPHFQIRLIDGTPIDRHDELDAGAIGKPGTAPTDSTVTGDGDYADDEELLRRIASGEILHPSVTSLAGRYAADGEPIEDCIQVVREAFEAANAPRYKGRWKGCERAIRDIYAKEERKQAEEAEGFDAPHGAGIATAAINAIGYSDDAIRNLTPEAAHEALAPAGITPPYTHADANDGGPAPSHDPQTDLGTATDAVDNGAATSGNGAGNDSAKAKGSGGSGGGTSNAPSLVPALDPAWPVLAQAAYHGLAGEVVAQILPQTEGDAVALLLQYLISFGNAVGRLPYYLVERTPHYANLFGVLVGTSSKGRKGTTADRIQGILEVADPDWVNTRVRGGASSGEGIIWAVRDPIYGLRRGETVLVDEGIADKRLLLDEREFTQPLVVMQREGNVLSRIFREAYDCRRMLESLTKNSPARATEAFISILGHITIDELRRMLDHTSMANGFANRFLFACVRRSKLLPEGGDPDDEGARKLGAKTLEALNIARTRDRVILTEAARQHWRQVYPELSREQPGLFGAIVARAEAHTIRLALIYALLARAEQIDRVHLEAARAVWSFCEASAQYVFGDLIGEPIADTILRLLRNSGTAGMTRTEISNALGRNVAANKIDAALVRLAAANKVYCGARTQGRRGIQTWFAK